MQRTPVFDSLHSDFNLTVWNDGTISILSMKDNCAISTGSFSEIYELLKKEANKS